MYLLVVYERNKTKLLKTILLGCKRVPVGKSLEIIVILNVRHMTSFEFCEFYSV